MTGHAATVKAMPDGVKWWLVACVAVLVLSGMVFAAAVVGSFASFSEKTTPLWVTVVGALGMFGMGVGFAGLLLLMVVVAVRARRAEKRRAVDLG